MADAAKVPKTPESQVDISPDIEDNILDQFDLPTYHFRLYMMSEDAIRANTFGPGARQQRVVIAESGVTSIGIDEVEVETVSGISREAGIGTATQFNITLREPFGSTLLDQIASAAKFLGVKNFSKIPFFLELSFKGRDGSEGSNQAANADNELRDLVWVWPIILTKMAMDVNTGGSSYVLNAAIYGDIAQTNQASDTQKAIVIEAETVGDFFTEFQAQMNRRAEEKTKTAGYEFADTYEFFIDEEIFEAVIVPDKLEDRQNRAAGFTVDSGKMEFSFQPPISVDRVVENILSLTSFFQKEIKATDDPDAAGDDSKGEEAVFQTLYRMIPDVKIGQYDSVRNDYQRIFRYLIIPYEMTTITTPSNNNSTQSSDQRYNALARKGRIKKLYNYIYTGLNNQVLDFNLTFNFNWYAALPLQAGVSTNPAAAEPKAALSDVQKSKADVAADGINKARGFLSSASGFNPQSFLEDSLSEFLDPVSQLQNTTTNSVSAASVEVSDVIGAQIADADAAIVTSQAGLPGSTVFVPGVSEVLGSNNVISGSGTLVQRLTAQTQFPRVSPSGKSSNSAQEELRERDIFVDDPSITEERADNVLGAPGSSVSETASGTNNADTGQLAQSAGRTMLSAMFEQAKSPIAADLLNIDLEIKGDPYWLEPPPVKRTDPPRSSFDRMLANRGFIPTGDSGLSPQSDTELQNFTVADSGNAQTYMVFRSFTPQEFDPETGLTPAGKKSNNVLNGVYGVRTVTHTFAGGQFTQALHALRDPKINLKNVDLLSYLNKDASEEQDEAPLEEITVTTTLRNRTGDDGFGNTDENTQSGIGATGG